MKGYLFNFILVAAGSLTGLFAGKILNESTKEAVFSVLGMITIFIGIKMSLNTKEVIPVVFCLATGTIAGSLLGIEERIDRLVSGVRLPERFGKINTEGFLTASTLFCVGSMTIIGSLKDGLYNDGVLIKTKSVMDGFASMILASKFGLSVVFSAFSVLIIQGGLTIFSKHLSFLASERMMGNIDGVGGIIVLSIGVNLLNLKHLKTLDMLPSLLFIILYGLWLS